MAIRWGRGNGPGLFAVRARTAASMPGVDPRDLARPRTVPTYDYPDVRVYGGRLWVPVEAIGRGGMGRHPASLEEVVAHLSAPARVRRADEGGVIGLDVPPFATPYDWSLHHARAIQQAGEVPAAARDLVEPARQAASLSVARRVASDLLHDGERAWSRLPVPLLNPTDPGRPSSQTFQGLHEPCFLHTRIGPGGKLPFSSNESVPQLCEQAARIAALCEGVDLGFEDIERFVVSVPAALASILRSGKGPAIDPLVARLFDLMVEGARGDVPAIGLEAACETVVEAARAVQDMDLPGGPAGYRRIHRERALLAVIGFVERVARPAFAGAPSPEDEAAIAGLAP